MSEAVSLLSEATLEYITVEMERTRLSIIFRSASVKGQAVFDARPGTRSAIDFGTMTTAPQLAIRMRRAAFNRAIADADLNAIASVLAPDAVLVAGTDSAVIAGRKAQLATWKREFASRDRMVYVRTPGEIAVSPLHPIAFEYGEWQGLAAAGGAQVASGPYTAKWRQIGEDWVIEAELFLAAA